MRLSRYPVVALVVLGGALCACGSSKPGTSASSTTIANSSGSANSATTQPAGGGGGGGGAADCATLKPAMADILINWQIVIGLSSSPTSTWASTPVGDVAKFGDQLKIATAALGGNADAATALKFMQGADDIVVRGLGGDSTAQADLATYMGTDITASVQKQLPLSIAYASAGCK